MPPSAAWTPITLRRHSYFWVGVETRATEAGTITTGDHLLCEYFIPEKVTFPYPIVLVHGGGQSIVYHGLMEQPGWIHRLLSQGFATYVIERPGHGRTGYRPDVFGPPPAPVPIEVYTGEAGLLSGARRGLTQWPGSGAPDDPATLQLLGSIGGAPSPVGALPEALCRQRGVELLERIGPSVLLAASAGGVFAWHVADARPDLVKGIVCVEGMPPTTLQAPLTFDPPIDTVDDLVFATPPSTSNDLVQRMYARLQAEPARQLPRLAQVPIAYAYTDEALDPRFQQMVQTGAAFLRQAGCEVDVISLTAHGVHGNTHFVPLETNNGEVLDIFADWIRTHIA